MPSKEIWNLQGILNFIQQIITIFEGQRKFSAIKVVLAKNIKRTKGLDNTDVNGCVLKRFKQAWNNIPINGPIMKGKAEQSAARLNIQDFKISTNCLSG